MYFLENGAIIGNYNTDEYVTVAPGVEKLEASGKNLTVSFIRYGAEHVGLYAPTPRAHCHEVEEVNVMMAGSATAIVNGKRTAVRKGGHWTVPKGIAHTVDLRESEPGVLIMRIYPTGTNPATGVD